MLLSPIVFMGDSITEGMEPHLMREVAKLGVKVEVYFKSGSSAQDWVENDWVEDVLDASGARMAVIALGTNPSGDGSKYARQMATLVSECEARGVVVYVVGPFALDEDGERTAALLSYFPKPKGIDGYALAAGLPRAGVMDIHFTAEGYNGLASRLVAAVAYGSASVHERESSIVPTLAGLLVAMVGILTVRWWGGR